MDLEGRQSRDGYRRNTIPLDLLVVRHDPVKVPDRIVMHKEDIRQHNSNIEWASKREQLFATAAAGVHLTLFAFNLAFWGFEGQAPDRYWPDNPRLRLRLRPMRYGNLEVTKEIWYKNLAKMEGID